MNQLSPQSDRVSGTFFVAIEARDAFLGAVVIHTEPCRFGLHRTHLVARAAINAIGITFREDSGQPVEYGEPLFVIA